MESPWCAGPDKISTMLSTTLVLDSLSVEVGRTSRRWAHPAPVGSGHQKPPGTRLARGFLPASTGRSAWTAMRVVRSRESLFGLRVAVGVHKQGCVWAARQSNAQRVQGVGERKKPDSARARDTGKGYSTIAWSSRCCEAPVCAVGMVQHRPAGCAGARLVVQVQRLKEGADVDPTWTNKRYAAPLLQVRTTHRSSSIAPPSCLTLLWPSWDTSLGCSRESSLGAARAWVRINRKSRLVRCPAS